MPSTFFFFFLILWCAITWGGWGWRRGSYISFMYGYIITCIPFTIYEHRIFLCVFNLSYFFEYTSYFWCDCICICLWTRLKKLASFVLLILSLLWICYSQLTWGAAAEQLESCLSPEKALYCQACFCSSRRLMLTYFTLEVARSKAIKCQTAFCPGAKFNI